MLSEDRIDYVGAAFAIKKLWTIQLTGFKSDGFDVQILGDIWLIWIQCEVR